MSCLLVNQLSSKLCLILRGPCVFHWTQAVWRKVSSIFIFLEHIGKQHMYIHDMITLLWSLKIHTNLKTNATVETTFFSFFLMSMVLCMVGSISPEVICFSFFLGKERRLISRTAACNRVLQFNSIFTACSDCYACTVACRVAWVSFFPTRPNRERHQRTGRGGWGGCSPPSWGKNSIIRAKLMYRSGKETVKNILYLDLFVFTPQLA